MGAPNSSSPPPTGKLSGSPLFPVSTYRSGGSQEQQIKTFSCLFHKNECIFCHDMTEEKLAP
jgi:hypothetical protein